MMGGKGGGKGGRKLNDEGTEPYYDPSQGRREVAQILPGGPWNDAVSDSGAVRCGLQPLLPRLRQRPPGRVYRQTRGSFGADVELWYGEGRELQVP